MPPKLLEIKIKGGLNPYYVPSSLITKNETIIYTDQNINGESALLKFDNNKNTIIRKFSSIGINLELCQANGKSILGVFSKNELSQQSKIYDFSNQIVEENKLIYSSNINDLGKINCQYKKDTIYFLRSIKSEQVYFSELFSLNTKSKELIQLTKEKFVHQFYTMGNRMFVSVNGKQLLIFGNKELIDDSIPTGER